MAWLRRGGSGRFFRAGRERVLSLSHRWFVTGAFRGLLGRDPDDAGMRHFVRELSRGQTTREQVMHHIGHSGEGAASVLFSSGIRDHIAEFSALRAGAPPTARPVCFLHPMKCGGTALTLGLSLLADPWPRLLDVWVDQLVCLPQPLLAQAMLVTGHLPYGTLALLPKDTAACTVVREPVARTLSHFTHVRTHGRQMQLTLEEFVSSQRWRPVWVDYQARHLAVDVPVEEAWQGRHAGLLQELVDAPLSVTVDELTERALERLDAVELVGISDDLDALVRRVAEFWGKSPPPPVPRSNESLLTVAADEVTDHVRELILEGTRADAALYQQARERAE